MSSGSRSSPVIFLHVGGPKTGTTYLQELLWHNRDALRAGGICYPGGTADAQFLAAQDLMDISFHEQENPRVAGAWTRLVEEIRRASCHTAVVSHELLSLAAAEGVARAMRDLAFAVEVHIVYTARDLARQIPSVWQEDLKNRHALSFDRFVRGIRGDEPEPHWLAGLFWRWQNVLGVLQTWGAPLPPERVHVVTVPPPGGPPGVLWERFAAALRLDPTVCRTDVPRAANTSLGVVESNLLRRLNPRLRAEFDWPAYEHWVKDELAARMLGTRPDQIPLLLPDTEHDWVHDRSAEVAATLTERKYDVVGDLDDLVPAAPQPGGRHPDDASDAELLDAANDTIVAFLRGLAGVSSADAAPAPDLLPASVLFRLGVRRLSRDHPSVALLGRAWATARRRAGHLRR